MKYIALAIISLLSLSLTACEFNKESVDTEDLEKAGQFAICSAACFNATYGNVPE